MEDAQKEKRRLEELLADTGDQIDKRIKFANEAFEFVEHAILKFKTGPKVRTAKKPVNPEGKQTSYGAGKTEIEQSLARSQSMLRHLDSNPEKRDILPTTHSLIASGRDSAFF